MIVWPGHVGLAAPDLVWLGHPYSGSLEEATRAGVDGLGRTQTCLALPHGRGGGRGRGRYRGGRSRGGAYRAGVVDARSRGTTTRQGGCGGYAHRGVHSRGAAYHAGHIRLTLNRYGLVITYNSLSYKDSPTPKLAAK
ncbi:hypothetical protein VN97_g342 [Penicillium thymicola]|uniref:Uncharacterized protein n=1 Tax=Penicillium thymicola TaxID=293382 RepID=A0AAI9TTK5_PENTH|nr:hypothetical protein VN97_g342 [Penicillium thymicola]